MKLTTSLASIGRRLIGGFGTRRLCANGSKYMPHTGSKERARHAGNPDGAMHGLPPLHRVTAP